MISDGTDSLDVDAEATELCVVIRDYLKNAWVVLVQLPMKRLGRRRRKTPNGHKRAQKPSSAPQLPVP